MKTFSSFALALLALGCSALAGLDLGSTARGTPYDAYMRPVKQVLGSLDGATPDMKRVESLMVQGRNFSYSFTEPYVAALPSVTESLHAGDCKAKALWLCAQLGDRNCRFVVGKQHAGAKLSHAWVLWREQGGRWYILDCTNNYRPVPADSVSSNDYVPLYSWSKGACYQHAATSGLASVAGKRTLVASR